MTLQQARTQAGRGPPCDPPFRHSCQAPSQHNLLWWMWRNPTTPLKFAVQDLHITPTSLWVTRLRLSKRADLQRLCPLCFSASLEGEVCQRCGAETLTALRGFDVADVDFTAQSPVHRLLPAPLGTSTDYRRVIKASDPKRPKALLVENAKGIRHIVEGRSEDPLETAIKSKVLQVLKGRYPPDHVSETAALMIASYVKSLRRTFPSMPLKPKWAVEDGTSLVLASLEQAYPAWKGKLRPRHFRAT